LFDDEKRRRRRRRKCGFSRVRRRTRWKKASLFIIGRDNLENNLEEKKNTCRENQ
jgi:hypothetical protein